MDAGSRTARIASKHPLHEMLLSRAKDATKSRSLVRVCRTSVEQNEDGQRTKGADGAFNCFEVLVTLLWLWHGSLEVSIAHCNTHVSAVTEQSHHLSANVLVSNHGKFTMVTCSRIQIKMMRPISS